MASKRARRRKLRSHMCTGKKAYAKKNRALRAIFESRKSGLDWMNAYKCRFCGKWHIGHLRKYDYNRRKG